MDFIRKQNIASRIMKIKTALGKTVEVKSDYTLDQDWKKFTRDEHALWDTLYRRQRIILQNRAFDEFLRCQDDLQLSKSGIPNFEELSERLYKRTKWAIVAVPDLVPDEVFFTHLSKRCFPCSDFIRRPDQIDYIQEPDIFHDVFGHIPLLANPVFADYMEAYGKGGLRAAGSGHLAHLARLYWYTVEFGLIKTEKGLRIYGSGIASSRTESLFALEDPSPNRIHFNLMRVMQTKYRIDDFQQVYFVIDSIEELFSATLQNFENIYKKLQALPDLAITELIPSDLVYTRGTQEYARLRQGQPQRGEGTH